MKETNMGIHVTVKLPGNGKNKFLKRNYFFQIGGMSHVYSDKNNLRVGDLVGYLSLVNSMQFRRCTYVDFNAAL